MRKSPTRRRRLTGLAVSVTTTAGLLFAVPHPASAIPLPTPPPNPTNQQLNSAQAQKDAVASRIGQLSGQIADAQQKLQELRGRSDLAEQKYALKYQQLQIAQQKAAAASVRIAKARQSVVGARTKFTQYVQAQYMDGQPAGMTGVLLSANDPNSLLDQSALLQYQSQSNLTAIDQLQQASVELSNADAAAKVAKQNATSAAAAAKNAQRDAQAALADQQTQTASLQNTMSTAQVQLTSAKSQLATLTGQRAQFNAYLQEVARLQEIARQQKLAHDRAVARQQEIDRQQSEARAQARQRNNNGGSSGGGGSSYSAGPVSSPAPPSGGSWTAAKGRRAAHRALSWLGEPYIWAAGNQYGPTDGGCSDPIAPCGTVGFDCSGLVLFAWGQSWDHFAATQYTQAGGQHPSSDNFKPGDLLFWSGDGTIGGIGHVAIYIGHGDVVQAPQSGDVVKITPWQQVESGYYGATRPLT
ncbi:MAG: NlpC/P60 family protein [Jatrophihabitans sp.]